MQLFELFGTVFLKGNEETSSKLSKLDKLAGGVGKTMGKIAKVGAVAAAAAGTAAIAFGVTAVKAAASFETGMANVATLLDGDVTTKIAKMGDAVQALQKKTGTSAELLSGGLYQIVSAFGDTADSMKILDTAAQAASAGRATVTDSVNLLSAVTKGYGDTSAKAAEKASDLAFMTVKLGVTTFPELAASMGAVVPLAAAMKVSQEELFGAMATLTGVTGGTSEVTTQLRGTIQGLMKPTKEMQGALEKMGYKTGAAALESLGLQGTLAGLNKQVKGDKTELGNLFGSIEAVNAVLALTGAQAKDFTDKTKAMSKATGSTSEAFKTQQKTLNSTLARAKETLNVFLTDVGQKFLPGIVGGVETAMGAISPILDKLAKGLGDAGGDFGKMGDALGTALSDVITLLTNNAPKMIDMGMKLIEALLDGLMKNLPALGKAAIQLLMKLIDVIMKNLPMLIQIAAEILRTLVVAILTALPVLIPQLVEIIFSIIDILIDNLDLIISAAIQIILALTMGLLSAIPKLMERLPEIIQAIVDGLIDNLPLLLAAAVQILIALAVGLIAAIPELIAFIPQIIMSVVDALTGYDWGGLGGELLDSISDGFLANVGSMIDSATSAAKQAINSVKKFLGMGVDVDIPVRSSPQGRSMDVPEYATGTNYVPRTGLALVHKGETIVPADYPAPISGDWQKSAQATQGRAYQTSQASTQNSSRRVDISGKIEVKVKSLDEMFERVYEYVVDRVQDEVALATR